MIFKKQIFFLTLAFQAPLFSQTATISQTPSEIYKKALDKMFYARLDKPLIAGINHKHCINSSILIAVFLLKCKNWGYLPPVEFEINFCRFIIAKNSFAFAALLFMAWYLRHDSYIRTKVWKNNIIEEFERNIQSIVVSLKNVQAQECLAIKAIKEEFFINKPLKPFLIKNFSKFTIVKTFLQLIFCREAFLIDFANEELNRIDKAKESVLNAANERLVNLGYHLSTTPSEVRSLSCKSKKKFFLEKALCYWKEIAYSIFIARKLHQKIKFFTDYINIVQAQAFFDQVGVNIDIHQVAAKDDLVGRFLIKIRELTPDNELSSAKYNQAINQIREELEVYFKNDYNEQLRYLGNYKFWLSGRSRVLSKHKKMLAVWDVVINANPADVLNQPWRETVARFPEMIVRILSLLSDDSFSWREGLESKEKRFALYFEQWLEEASKANIGDSQSCLIGCIERAITGLVGMEKSLDCVLNEIFVTTEFIDEKLTKFFGECQKNNSEFFKVAYEQREEWLNEKIEALKTENKIDLSDESVMTFESKILITKKIDDGKAYLLTLPHPNKWINKKRQKPAQQMPAGKNIVVSQKQMPGRAN